MTSVHLILEGHPKKHIINMLHKQLLLILFVALMPIGATAQTDPAFCKQLVPDQKIFDFGTIQEKNGPVTHTFLLTNTSTKPIVIRKHPSPLVGKHVLLPPSIQVTARESSARNWLCY